jgi:hypothetical protein
MNSDTLTLMTTDQHGYSDTDYPDAVASGHVPAPEQPSGAPTVRELLAQDPGHETGSEPRSGIKA